MTEGLLTYDEAVEHFEGFLADLIDRNPDGARSLLGLGSEAPLELTEPLRRRAAWVGMLTRAIDVRCGRICDHEDRYAWLRFGLLVCGECIEDRFGDVPSRDGGGCDVCGGPVESPVPVEHRLAERRVIVLANCCQGCGELAGSLRLPPTPMSLN